MKSLQLIYDRCEGIRIVYHVFEQGTLASIAVNVCESAQHSLEALTIDVFCGQWVTEPVLRDLPGIELLSSYAPRKGQHGHMKVDAMPDGSDATEKCHTFEARHVGREINPLVNPLVSWAFRGYHLKKLPIPLGHTLSD